MASNTMNKNIFTALSDNEVSDHEIVEIQEVKTTPSVEKPVENEPSVKISDITPFKGRDVVPLRKKMDNEFPILGAEPETKESKSKERKTKDVKPLVTRFVLATSYSSERRGKQSRQNNQGTDRRSRAFSHMENKEDVAKSLQCTRACNNVRRLKSAESAESAEPEYGVCYRESCSFAHSLDQLNDPMCGFDESCRFRDGKTRPDGSLDTDAKCKFRHSNETREEWINRTGRSLPDLPQTHEKTRKPIASKAKPDAKPDATTPPLQAKSSTKPEIVNAPVKEHVKDTASKPSVNKWGIRKLSFPSESSDESDYSRRRRRRHRHSRSPTSSHRLSSESTRVISVPTSELAEIAIKAAINQGITNLRVVVE